MTIVSSYLDRLAEAGAQRDAQRDQAAQRRQAAEEARARSAELDAEAQLHDRDGDTAARQANRDLLRQLRRQLNEARSACLDAMSRGDDPVGHWIRYRLQAAKIQGTWDALSEDYERTTGVRPPPGPSPPSLTRDGTVTAPEPFDVLLLRTQQKAEHDARQAARAETLAAKAAREQQQAGKTPA